MREAHANADAVFEYVGAMGELLQTLHQLATIQKLDVTGPEEELTKIMPGFDFLSHCTTFYFKELGLSTIPVLGYWGIIGRGDACRILLHHLGVKFEDKMYAPGAEPMDGLWPGNKSNLGMVLPNMPYWKEGNVIHAETLPVLRSICRKYCPAYLGRTQKEQADADAFANTIYGDFGPFLGAAMFAPDYKENIPYNIEAALKLCNTVQTILGDKLFIAGDITYTDFMVYWALKYFNRFEASIITSFPKLIAYVERMNFLKNVDAAEKLYDTKLALLPGNAGWMEDHPFDPEVPVLGYWGIIGRGDQCRILLHHLGVKFEDKLYAPGAEAEDGLWPGNKDNLGMVVPNMPYWKEGDVVHAETLQVLRSICRKYNPQYLGRNPKE